MFMMLGKTQLHYVIEGEGIPIIMIHGKSVDYRLMHGCLEPIFSHNTGYKRIYFDIPGMGESTPGEDIKADSNLVDILIQAIEFLVGEEKFLVIGESYGGHLTRGILQQKIDQVTGVAFICPWIAEIDQTMPERKVLVKDEAFLQSLTDEEKDYFCSAAVVQIKDAYDLFVRDIWSGIKLYNGKFCDELERDLVFDRKLIFNGPSLFITARQDHWVGYEAAFKLLQVYPRASYSVLDCGGHNVQIERSELFETLVIDWLKRIVINKEKY